MSQGFVHQKILHPTRRTFTVVASSVLRARRRFEATGQGPVGYLYALPAVCLLVLFTYWPMVSTLNLSFYRWNMVAPVKAFVGLSNYRTLLTLDDFWIATWNTAKYIAGILPLTVALPLLVAMLLINLSSRIQTILKVSLFSPTVVSFAVGSIAWLWILNPIFGVLNQSLRALGVTGRSWLSDPHWALWAIVALTAWKSFGYNLVIFMAGLSVIPPEYHDAAAVDGASPWQVFRHITWPLLSSTTLFVGLTAFLTGVQFTFTPVQILTEGGPDRSSTNLVYFIYQYGFQFFQTGLASATAVLMFVALLAATWTQFRLLERFVHYES